MYKVVRLSYFHFETYDKSFVENAFTHKYALSNMKKVTGKSKHANSFIVHKFNVFYAKAGKA